MSLLVACMVKVRPASIARSRSRARNSRERPGSLLGIGRGIREPVVRSRISEYIGIPAPDAERQSRSALTHGGDTGDCGGRIEHSLLHQQLFAALRHTPPCADRSSPASRPWVALHNCSPRDLARPRTATSDAVTRTAQMAICRLNRTSRREKRRESWSHWRRLNG